jgi:hypothetical protein
MERLQTCLACTRRSVSPGFGTVWRTGLIGLIHVVASHTSIGAAVLFALRLARDLPERRFLCDTAQS